MQRELNIISTDIKEIEAYLSEVQADVSLSSMPGEATFGVVGKIARFGGLELVWARIIGNYEVRPQTVSDAFGFHFVRCGSTVYGLDDCSIAVPKDSVLSFRYPRYVRMNHDSVHATLAVPNCMVQNRLSLLLDRPATKNIEFFRGPIDCLDTVPGISKLIHEFENSSLLAVVEAIGDRSTSIADAIVDSILISYPSNFTEVLSVHVSNVAPRHVKRALDFIHANSQRQITPQRLADLSSVSIRCLQYSFRSTTGYTISEYQRNLRLRGACDDLIARPDIPVHIIAAEWGFPSVSMFGQLCRKAYGLTPSALRARKK